MDPGLIYELARASANTYLVGAIPTFENPVRSCRVYHSQLADGTHVFAFEGTTDLTDWLVDFMAEEVPAHVRYEHAQLGLVHAGFLLDAQSAQGFLLGCLHGLGYPPYYITGHSKGAGEAILAAALMRTIGHAPVGCAAFEPPRVGGDKLNAVMADIPTVWTQTYNADGKDIVTLVPAGFGFRHVGPALELKVPDTYGLMQKHRMATVLGLLAVPKVEVARIFQPPEAPVVVLGGGGASGVMVHGARRAGEWKQDELKR